MTDRISPQVLLTWMRKRDGVITGRDISDSGPRPFRRRAAADTALAALIETGKIIEVSSRPRAFGVAVAEQKGGKFPPLGVRSIREIPELGGGIGDLVDAAVARHRADGRSATAALVLAAADVRDALRRDPHHAPELNADGCCQHCDGAMGGDVVDLMHGIRVHLGCVLRYRNAVDRQLTEAIVTALEESRD